MIKRYLSDDFLNSFTHDFRNLIKIVNASQGELDFAIRENYFNLYYKGNSLGNISRVRSGGYKVKLHEKFFNHTQADVPEFFVSKKQVGSYVEVSLNAEEHPRRFMQKSHIDQFCSRIKQVNYGEEIVFEQALITDNLDRKDLIIIDRQVTDTALNRKRMDLLALEQISPDLNRYGFLVIEVKLGNNPELKKDVADQLESYTHHIETYLDDYRYCYQTQYIQKKALGILSAELYESIDIQDQVRGMVVVGGYSKMAEQSIRELQELHPEIQVKLFDYKLEGL